MQLLFGIKSRFQLFLEVCVKQLVCNIFNLRKNVKDSEFGILYFSITYLLKCDTKINNLAFSFLRWDEKKKVIIISKPLCVLAIQGVSIYFSTLMILLYITHNVQFVITAHIYQLSTHFELKVLGPLRYFWVFKLITCPFGYCSSMEIHSRTLG